MSSLSLLKKTRRASTVLLSIFVILTIASSFLCIGGGGVLNDFYLALEEIQELERKNILGTPPDDISSVAKREIDLGHNSEDLKKYINETQESLTKVETALFIFIGLSIFTLFLKIYLKRRLNKEGADVT